MQWNLDGKPRKPLIVGIGAQKAGTSWLVQMLRDHPQVWVTPFKEAHYFNHRFIEEHRRWIGWHYRQKPVEIRAGYARRGETMPEGMDAYLTRVSTTKNKFTDPWYRWMFQPAPAGAKPMETTPEYSQLPDEGVAHMAAWLPDTRFIYQIRDPVDRAVSQMKMNLGRRKVVPGSLDAWLAEAADPVLLERGDYAAYVPRWDRHAGGRVLYLAYGRIAREPLALLAEVEAFCGLDPFAYDRPERVVYPGPEHLAVPPEAVALLRERMAPQYAFLRERFGPEFLADTV